VLQRREEWIVHHPQREYSGIGQDQDDHSAAQPFRHENSDSSPLTVRPPINIVTLPRASHSRQRIRRSKSLMPSGAAGPPS
jgi:hypothetical protein